MKVVVAFVLIVLMFATPATQVLAQTPQQQDVPARQDVPPAQPFTPGVTLDQSLVPELPSLPMTDPMDALLPAPNTSAGFLRSSANIFARPPLDVSPMRTPNRLIQTSAVLFTINLYRLDGVGLCYATPLLADSSDANPRAGDPPPSAA